MMPRYISDTLGARRIVQYHKLTPLDAQLVQQVFERDPELLTCSLPESLRREVGLFSQTRAFYDNCTMLALRRKLGAA